jgi:hypothetical protein
MLTQIFQIRRLLNQAINLTLRPQLFTRPEVLSGKLLLNSAQHLQRTRILHFLGILFVILRGSDAGAMARSTDNTIGSGDGGSVAHDGLAALGRVVWLEGGGVAVVEAPG